MPNISRHKQTPQNRISKSTTTINSAIEQTCGQDNDEYKLILSVGHYNCTYMQEQFKLKKYRENII